MNFSNTNIISDKNTCSHCAKKFSSKQKLHDHLTRCGKEPTLLFCPHCDKSYTSYVYFNNHLTSCQNKGILHYQYNHNIVYITL